MSFTKAEYRELLNSEFDKLTSIDQYLVNSSAVLDTANILDKILENEEVMDIQVKQINKWVELYPTATLAEARTMSTFLKIDKGDTEIVVAALA